MTTSTPPLIPLEYLAGNPPTYIYPPQVFLLAHLDFIVTFWQAVWIFTLLVICKKFIEEYLRHRKNRVRK